MRGAACPGSGSAVPREFSLPARSTSWPPGLSLTIALRIVLAIDCGLMTSRSSTVVETEPDVTVITPRSIRNEAVYRLPSAFKVTRPSDIGASIAATPSLGHAMLSRRRNPILCIRTGLARDLHTKRRISPYRLHVGHRGRLLLLPQLASNPRKRLSQISFHALRVPKGRVEDGFHVGSRRVVTYEVFSRALPVNTQDVYHDEGYERRQTLSEVRNC